MNRVKESYNCGLCPDCDNVIPNDVVEGCLVCGHVFCPDDEDADFCDEDDGQPSWEQEWHDFDPDC